MLEITECHDQRWESLLPVYVFILIFSGEWNLYSKNNKIYFIETYLVRVLINQSFKNLGTEIYN